MFDLLSTLALFTCFAGGAAFALVHLGFVVTTGSQSLTRVALFVGDGCLYLYVFGGALGVFGGIGALALRALAVHS